jgi:predicted RND superfamily exporter protein
MTSRHARFLACIFFAWMVVTYPFLLYGVNRSLVSMKNSPTLWIPDSFAGLKTYRQFTERFDSSEVILISWEGATVDDERLEVLAAELLKREALRAGPKHYSAVSNGFTQLRQMMAPPLNLSRPAALRRLQGSMVGPERQQSCVLVFLTERGSQRRGKTIQEIRDRASEVSGLDGNRIYIVGTPVDGAALDELSRQSLEKLAIPSTILSFFLCWFCLRSLWFTVPVVLIAAYGQSLSLALVHFTGNEMNAVLIVLPTFVFVLSISSGIHLTNYFMEEIRRGQRGEAVRRAIDRAWSPTSLAALTTAIGLLSLLVSEVEPVRQFGWLGASGVLCCFALLFLIMPGVMHRWLDRYGHIGIEQLPALIDPEHATPFWKGVTAVVARFRRPIVVGGIVLVAITGWGLQHLRTSADVMAMLDVHEPVVRDSVWFQENIGPLVPVEVIIRFPKDSPIDVMDRLRLVTEIHTEMHRVESIGGVVSLATFLPSVPKQSGLGATVSRSMLRKRIESEKKNLEDSGYLKIDDDGEHWRIGGRAPGHAAVDYIDFLETLSGRIEPLVRQFRDEHGIKIETVYTGGTSAIFEVQRALLGALFHSFLTAVLIVAILMTVTLGRLRAGLLAMIPNLFPTFLMFGTLGWIGRSVDIGSVMTASVALGIAVDGTFHYLAAFRSEVALGHSSLRSVANSYQHCGRALLQTTFVCSIGMAIFCFSSFLPARYFTYTFIMLLVIAVIGDLVLLPALLLSPLARLFERGRFKSPGTPSGA